jgi:GNAT superfamily N-acetyltransferase
VDARPEQQTVGVMEHREGIRRAGTGDIQGLLAIDQRAAGGDVQRAWDLHRYVDGGHCYVNVNHGRLDGYVVVTPRNFFGRDFVDLLFVAPPARRSGVGTRLLRSALDLEGTRQVFTSTNRSNTPMRELLRREGWQTSGELEGLDEGDPEVFYFTWRP